jgi:beta-lactamase superfamily II metal-dependent hydrolase
LKFCLRQESQGGECMSYTGLEIDTLSLGDADCIVVTQWRNGLPYRLLVDGGCASDADKALEWLVARGFTYFTAVLCTHLHNDHAAGLVKIVSDPRITFFCAYMHDIRQHAMIDDLRRAARKDDNIRQALDLTEQLHAAFVRRGVTPVEPFTGSLFAGVFEIEILGPSRPFYEEILKEAMPVLPLFSSLVPGLAPPPANSADSYGTFSASFSPPPKDNLSALLQIFLSQNSSLEDKPKTQVFNETSVILGIREGACRALLTGDAGCRALAAVGPEWHGVNYLDVPHHGSSGNLSAEDAGRFRPKYAVVSAKGNGHPDDAVVSALCKAGSKVASTHRSGNLWYSVGNVPQRNDYSPVDFMEGKGSPIPVSSVPFTDWASLLVPAPKKA